MSTQFRASLLLLVVVLPLILVSFNAMESELDVELLESLTEEENDEKDGEDTIDFFAIHFSVDVTVENTQEEEICLGKKALFIAQDKLSFKVPTPPPELS